jgi:hypothetical protein
MDTEARTPAEQSFWDAIFASQFPICMKTQKRRGAQYCAHLAREQADAALAERRLSAKGDAK